MRLSVSHETAYRYAEHERPSPFPFLRFTRLTEAWLDDAWYSFDVTHQLPRHERHLKLAVGLDYLDACPERGMRCGAAGEQRHARGRQQ